MVPLAVALYGASNATPGELCAASATLLFGQAVVLMTLLTRVGPLRRDPLFIALAVFGVGATAAYLLQDKGWFYQRLPATIVTILALVYWIAAAIASRRPTRGQIIALLAAACALGAFAQAAIEQLRPRLALARHPERSLEYRLEQVIRQEQARSYLAFSQLLSPGFPVVNETEVTWASRFDSMWALRGVLWRAREGLAPVRWPIRDWIATDFAAHCPDLVVLDDRDGIDYVRALQSSSAFAIAWSRYRPLTEFGGVRVFERSGQTCR